MVFGRVIRGQDIIHTISEVPVDAKDRPLQPVVVANCGELELRSGKKPQPVSRELTGQMRSPRLLTIESRRIGEGRH